MCCRSGLVASQPLSSGCSGPLCRQTRLLMEHPSVFTFLDHSNFIIQRSNGSEGRRDTTLGRECRPLCPQAGCRVTILLPIGSRLPLENRERSQGRRDTCEGRPVQGPGEVKESTMRVLRQVRKWWRAFWGDDLYWPMDVDSHQWDNKVEILRRLSSGPHKCKGT
jgi:hypothetical protein